MRWQVFSINYDFALPSTSQCKFNVWKKTLYHDEAVWAYQVDDAYQHNNPAHHYLRLRVGVVISKGDEEAGNDVVAEFIQYLYFQLVTVQERLLNCKVENEREREIDVCKDLNQDVLIIVQVKHYQREYLLS